MGLSERKFFPGLVKYMASGPVVCMVWEGLNMVKTGRVMLGETNPADSKPGTIRGDFCIQVGRNIMHGSDSVESANKEIALGSNPRNWSRSYRPPPPGSTKIRFCFRTKQFLVFNTDLVDGLSVLP